jgi:hypothetical protein
MSRAWIKRWRLEAQSGLQRPSELYADGGYISGPRLHRAAQEGWSLMGPAPASPRRPGVDRLPVEAFTVDIAQRARLLPGGPRKPTLQPHLRELQSQDLLPLQVAQKRLPTLPTARSLRSSLPTVSHADCGLCTTSVCNDAGSNNAPRPLSCRCISATPLKARSVNWRVGMVCGAAVTGASAKPSCRTSSLARLVTSSGGYGTSSRKQRALKPELRGCI